MPNSSAHARLVQPVVTGVTPPGTERAEVMLPDGTTVSAQWEDGWLAAWQPAVDADGAAEREIRDEDVATAFIPGSRRGRRPARGSPMVGCLR
jgi:hypothetical protein